VDAGSRWMPGAGGCRKPGDAGSRGCLGGCGRVRVFDVRGFGRRDCRRVPRSHFSPRTPRAPIPNPQ
jgi:hypothetical protein